LSGSDDQHQFARACKLEFSHSGGRMASRSARCARASENPRPARSTSEANEGAFAATVAQERAKIRRRRRLAERVGAGSKKPLRLPRRSAQTSEDPRPPRSTSEANEGAFAANVAQERAKIRRRRRLAERTGAGSKKNLRLPKRSALRSEDNN
jgi:hypothetical protein